ncbi:hypothetical protein MHZ92_11125 [Sporosarcina sp. ACRSL]|uniref:hypothetical protein n=1 Tax=Sporosarcina sp. ACRSL TaxID=2918215 RepID=UPI001EF453FD|nr:hypothetical protein [Sporosarcina sp. ACRSL]MCG7344691.1 hypothetical protein [Sporosarcina sp. ACRSL]
MDNFDRHVKEEVQGYLNKHVHFSRDESRKIHSKTTNKSSSKKFHGVYYAVLASAVVLFTIQGLLLLNNYNFTSNTKSDHYAVAEKETQDNEHIISSLDTIVQGKVNSGSRGVLSDEATNNLQQTIMNNPEKYTLKKASFNYWSKSGEHKDSYSSEEITLALSFQSQQNSYFTQIFKDKVPLEENHKIIEKVGDWNLIPDSERSNGENKYIIAISEFVVNNEVYSIIVQTYDIHDDFYASPYSKTDILDFIESLQPELAVKNLEFIRDNY